MTAEENPDCQRSDGQHFHCASRVCFKEYPAGEPVTMNGNGAGGRLPATD